MKNDVIGIYQILNTINDKRYIGQSIHCNDRFKQHIRELRGNRHTNKYLQNSWNKHGEQVFQFSVIEECNRNDLDMREIYWINHYDSCDHGYNCTYGGDSTMYASFPLSRNRAISKTLTGKKRPDMSGENGPNARKIVCLNTRKEYSCGVYAAEDVGIRENYVIRSCTTHRGVTEDCLVFCYYEEFIKMTDEDITNILETAKKTRNHVTSSQKVVCLNTREIFDSGKIAAKEYRADYSYLVKCCKGLVYSSGKDTQDTPMTWMFLDDYLQASEEEIQLKISNAINAKHMPRNRRKNITDKPLLDKAS